jgi:hypothetical protein
MKMATLPKSRSEIEAAKERIRLPELWKILALPGEPPRRDGVKFSSPLRPDTHPSCTFFDDGRRMIDWTTGKSYDGIDLLGETLGLKNGEAIRRFVEIANGYPVRVDPAPSARPQPKAKATRPKLSGLRKAMPYELEQIAASRNISVRAAELAQDLGTVRVCEVCGFVSWVVLDESGLCAEGRRLNGKSYPQVVRDGKVLIGERKAHTLRGSRKDWPVGILPAEQYRKSVETIALVEGGPDYLAALHFMLAQGRTGILPVAMLGRCQGLRGLHPHSRRYLQGMRVRIYPHADADNGSYKNAAIIAERLEVLGCEVDCFVFEGLKKSDGAIIKDLNDCVDVAPQFARRLEDLFP